MQIRTRQRTGGIIFDWVRRRHLFSVTVSVFSWLIVAGSWAEEDAEEEDRPVSLTRQAEDLSVRASRGDVDAKSQLAESYERGLGVPQSFAKAIRLYREAARDGHAPARRRLAALGVTLLAPTPQVAPDDEPEAEADVPTVYRQTSITKYVSADDDSVSSATHGAFSPHVIFSAAPGRKTRHLRISGHDDDLTGPRKRHIRHGSMYHKAQPRHVFGRDPSRVTDFRGR